MKNSKVYAAAVIVALIVSGLLISLPGGYDEYEYTFIFNEPSFNKIIANNNIYTEIYIEGCININEEYGHPRLPYFVVNFLLPNEKELDKIDIKVKEPVKYILENDVFPQQPEENCDTADIAEPAFYYDVEVYSSSEKYINKYYEVKPVGYLKGYPILSVRLYPIDYIPKEKTILFYKEIQLNINFKESEVSTNEFLRGDDIAYLVQNEEEVASYGNSPLTEYIGGICYPSESYDYVIITVEDMKNDWEVLRSHRENYSDISCTIVTVEDIESNSYYWNTNPIFNDTQAHIREFCKDAYQDWGIQYILLGGDNDYVPARIFTDRQETHTYDDMPCDLYYSNLDGDWYYSYQNIWGGGRGSGVNDKYSELMVGRICSRLEDTNNPTLNAIDKIIWYDNCNDNDWLSSVAFWGGDLGWSSTSKQYMEALRIGNDCYSQYTGFEEWNSAHPDYQIDTTERIYDADLGIQTGSHMWASVENDNASIINHLSHSSWNSPIGLWGWNYHYNTKPFFAYSQGCLGGRFIGYNYAGSEQLMCGFSERHAFALVLNTGYGYGSMYSTCGASQYQQKMFWHYPLYEEQNNQENWQLGKMMNYQRNTMGQYTDGNRVYCYVWYSSHLFGDPAQTLVLYRGTTVELEPGHNYLNYPGEDTTLKDIALDIGLSTGESVLVQDNGIWYAWIVGFTPDTFNRDIYNGDYIDVNVGNYYTWVI